MPSVLVINDSGTSELRLVRLGAGQGGNMVEIVSGLRKGERIIDETPRQEDPQITVPMVDIFIKYPGVSAQEVESPEFNVVLNMPEGTALSVTANLLHEMATKLRAFPK